MDFRETRIWVRAFGVRQDDGHEAPREKLRAAFEQFRDSVVPLGQEVAQSVPGYTDHSIEHCDSLWDIADTITGPTFELTPAETFVLGGAFLIHDLAMGLAAYKDGLPGILQSQQWKDLLWADWPDNAEYLQAQFEADVAIDPTWNGLTSPAIKSSLTSFLREHHAEEAENLLKQEWRLSSGEVLYLLPSPEIRHWAGELIGKIARSHWLDATELEAYLPSSSGPPSFLPATWSVDPIKIACVLRTADAAQIDSRRAHPLHTPFRQPQGLSKTHWEFQELMLPPQEDEGRLVFGSARSFNPDKAEAWWLAFDTVSMINNELQAVDSLSADRGRPRFRCRSVAGAEDPERFAKYVETSGWQPIDARPRIRNSIGVIQNLGGQALYGNERDVPLRELLANAVDASRSRVAAQGSDAHVPPVRIEFFKDGVDHYLKVRDFGIGMSAQSIAQYLCDFGSSGWRSASFRNQFPGALSRGYTSTGKYGIGFFSVFMIADDVRVRTRSLSEGPNETYILDFHGGLAHRPILRRAEQGDRFFEPGTEVLLKLNNRADARGGVLCAEYPFTQEEQVQFVTSLAFAARHSIEVSPLGSSEFYSAVDSQPWHEKPPAEIYRASHWDPWSRYQKTTGEETELHFHERLSPLLDDSGEVIGMLCADVLDSSYGNLMAAVGYCGGFVSGAVLGVSGVIEGVPTRASRDHILVPTTVERMHEWLHEQWSRRSRGTDQSERESLRLQSLAAGFGLQWADAPVGVTSTGVITVEELAGWMEGRQEFTVFEMSEPRVIDIPGSGEWIFHGHDLIKLSENAVAVMFSSRDFEDGLPDAEFHDPISESDFWDDPDLAESIGSWWWISHNSAMGIVVRAASEAWGQELRQVLMASVEGEVDLAAAGQRPAATYSGKDADITWRVFRK